MNQYRFEFLNDNNAPMAKCRYQIMQNDSILYQNIADENGRAAFNSELVAGKKIRVRFWAEGQRQDAAFSTEPFYWTENVITQPIKAPKVYEVKLRETQNKNNEPANYRQAFYEVQAGDTWEGIAKKCNTNASSIKFLNNLPDDSTLPEVGDALLLPQGAERPLDSGSPSDKGVIESHSNEPQNDSLKGLDEKTPGPEQDKPSILPQEVAPSVAENQPEHPPTIVENKKPEAKKKKDPIGDLLKKLDEEKSEQEKGKQSKLPQEVTPPTAENKQPEKERMREERSRSNEKPINRVISKQQTPQLITMGQMKKMWPDVSESKMQPILDELNANLVNYKLDTNLRKAHFFAQVMQEVGPTFKLREHLAYSAQILIKNFTYYKKHPSEAEKDAKLTPFSLKEKTIANKAYMDKWRSPMYRVGNIYDGDGYKFLGRGLKMTTGRNNYKNLNDVYPLAWPGENVNFLEHPELLEQPKYAVRSAVAFWKGNKLYELADQGASPNVVDKITRIINRGTDYAPRKANFTNTTIKVFR